MDMSEVDMKLVRSPASKSAVHQQLESTGSLELLCTARCEAIDEMAVCRHRPVSHWRTQATYGFILGSRSIYGQR